ncbi:sugar ABC transporter substrate-binding protein [Corallincola holothuriorum]|uniref:Sugar ABC transporter substrate-binding protein n=1 Tax=Corallincola holothuriorum TaxID=2282215 RepID=A0A368N4K0_9GAMM|nr:XrtA/PEP-CTERM system exopolysaccharide export protein [Corallincola holothuriorum]RCU45146.1 sugar ABC transporter substrate-binding protein [Corallincola holothuriorum]
MLKRSLWLLIVLGLTQFGCSSSNDNQVLSHATVQPSMTTDPSDYQYLIGAGDSLSIFVWGNPDISGPVTVRPDGKITTSLAEDLDAAGKTPFALAREIEKSLKTFIREPRVTVSVGGFVGPFSEQIRVIGEAANPRAINYRKHMTLLDVMIEVGGLTTYAAGNRATLVRVQGGTQQTFSVHLDDLVRDGDISANADVLPGDVIIIPEAWF